MFVIFKNDLNFYIKIILTLIKNELDPHQKETLIGSTLPLAATPHVHLTTIEFLDGRAVQPLFGTRASAASAQALVRKKMCCIETIAQL